MDCAYDETVSEARGLVGDRDPYAALAMVRERLEWDAALESECHGIVHQIGHEAYAKYGFDGALSYEDDLCGSGYIHGVVESHLDRVRDIVAALPTVCDPGSLKCFHGIGHGLMHKLDDDLQRSVSLCGTFSRPEQRITCAEGAFMEVFDSETRFHPSRYLKEDDPLFPCRGFDPVNEGTCTFYAVRYFLRLHPRAYGPALRWCASDASPTMVSTCIKGVGSAAMKQNVGDVPYVESICEIVPVDKRRYCIEGLVSYAIVHAAKSSAGAAVCPVLNEENRMACERSVFMANDAYPD